MRVCVSSACLPGSLYVAADIDHPEALMARDLGGVDGSVLWCHPKDEQTARDVVAQVGEFGDPNELLTRFRRRRRENP